MKLVNKVAGRKSKWKIVEKEFVQGKDVSQNDAWKLILLSDFFPKVFFILVLDLLISFILILKGTTTLGTTSNIKKRKSLFPQSVGSFFIKKMFTQCGIFW